MKKYLMLIILICICSNIYAQSYSNKLFSFNTDNSGYSYENGKYRIVGTKYAKDDYEEFSESDLCIDIDGWQYITKDLDIFHYIEYEDPVSDKIIIDEYRHPFLLLGEKYICIFPKLYNNFDIGYLLDDNFYATRNTNVISAIGKLEFDYNEQPFFGTPTEIYGIDKIKSITASSFYSEKTKNGLIKYRSSNLLYLFGTPYGNERYFIFNKGTYWVPGKNNNASGIGEFLKIEFNDYEDGVVVVNGYVDPTRHDLYKKNNRVKLVEIESLDAEHIFTMNYLFDDFVTFSTIKFPSKTNKIKITIKDVYKGSKWDDTVITAILPYISD